MQQEKNINSEKYIFATIYILLIGIVPNLDASTYFLTPEIVYLRVIWLFNMIKLFSCVQFYRKIYR